MNSSIVVLLAVLALSTASEIVQGPSVRTVNIGPDGSVIDSFAVGGAVADGPTPVLAAPGLRTIVGPALTPLLHEPVLPVPAPAVVAGRVYGAPFLTPTIEAPLLAKYFYEPSFYANGVPVPYGKAIVAGPSGTIIADHH
ncbi:hypothetical protein HHI36_001946 [Cryptolaemus montrouzieri]|uniref:Uncharacterized protein n=1 Tax=Cryptolaemus montrouzieri TaxID=559131 RepID=A0ABD2P940_9CUCU